MRILRTLLILSFASLIQAAKASEPRSFELGVVPYLPTTNLVVAYEPLRAHLEMELKRPVALSTAPDIKALIIVERNASFASLKDLSGKRVAMLDPMIVLSRLGREAFRQSGMQAERDYRIRIVKTPSNAVHAVLQGEAEAGITTANLVPQLADEMKHRLRILAESREIPGLMFPLLTATTARAGQMREILMRFVQPMRAGNSWMP
jgi:phosphonate transport system substrate-binding protein